MPEFRTSAYGTPCGATWALGTVWDRTGKIFKPWFRNWCSQPAARWGFSLSFRSVFKASGPRRPLILACLLVSVHAAILGAGTQRVEIGRASCRESVEVSGGRMDERKKRVEYVTRDRL